MLLKCYVKVPPLLKTFADAYQTYLGPIPKIEEGGRAGEFLFPGLSGIRENKSFFLL